MYKMNRPIFIVTIFLLLLTGRAYAQCTALGQNPSTAFPVCGITVFHQEQVPICGTAPLYVPGCTSTPATNYENKNPYWYKFTCYQGGTLGFVINPNNNDDYDWQLYDVTGLNPDAVYTNRNIIVAGNWAGTFGPTGASGSGISGIQCASDPTQNLNAFAQMPVLILGHNYILLVSHFSDSQFGYSLSFGGGTASITDPLSPALLAARAPCDGTLTTVKLNKAMKCDSLSADGSEFTLVPNVANVIAATGVNCSQSFDMDSINLTLDAPLPPGNYFLKIKRGSDGNTLVDNCGLAIPIGDSIPLTVYPLFPTPMDSLTQPGCAPDTLQLVFRKKIFCNSIEPGGSDFIISGPDTRKVISASGLNCSDGLSNKIILHLDKPLQLGGVYTITLTTGTDGNTILDECSKETPAGQFVNVNIADTVNADFTYNIIYNCDRDTVNYFHDGRNGVNKWTWTFDNTRQARLQNPVIAYASFGQKQTQLIVTNGVCKDTASIQLFLDNTLKAAFESPQYVCPNEPATFKDNSIGKQLTWNWAFDNGNNSTLQQPPPQTYPFALQTDRSVRPRLIVTDGYGCSDTAYNTILVPNSCFIDVPNAFTPNGDGINDYLYPLAAYKAKDLLFRIYNRFGQLVFESHDWSQRWDGRYKGQPADAATYVWVLHYTDTETGKVIDRKGTSILIR